MEIRSEVEYIKEPVRQLDITFVGGETTNDTLDESVDLKITPEYITIEWYGKDSSSDRIRVVERRNVLHYQIRNTYRQRPKPMHKPSLPEPGTVVAGSV